jgi:N utilization substance protein B
VNGHHARSRARRFAVQALYQWQLSKQNIDDIETQFIADYEMDKVDVPYLQELLRRTVERAQDLETLISPLLDRPFAEVDPVERAVLLIGAYELTSRLDIPYRVVINEAIRLAKTFGAQDSYKYINGILDKLAHKTRTTETPAALN